ncbi:hypothetical protein HPB48_009821 [Haemaphysalis longicornis]|uniref:Peptidase M13 C-terminal domain-containing protein n=1 Tax=Haemaphysalis longicornis TaxID=44386 RepID=A0A9J6G064_HAELO|nr:hypothetical protein HPB48_009821 [Haemaphysalis longicornis]
MNVRLASSQPRDGGNDGGGGWFRTGFVSSGHTTGVLGIAVSPAPIIITIGLCATTGLVVLLLLKTVWSASPKDPVCEGLDCSDPYRALETLLNNSVHPCEDLYAHVCSRWTENHGHTGFFQESLNRYLDKMHTIFTSSEEDYMGEELASRVRTFKHLYSDCLTSMDATEPTLEQDVAFLMNITPRLAAITESPTPRQAMMTAANISFTFNLNCFLVMHPQHYQLNAFLYVFTGKALQGMFPVHATLENYVQMVVRAIGGSQELAFDLMALDHSVAEQKLRVPATHRNISRDRLRLESPDLGALTDAAFDRLLQMSNYRMGYLLAHHYNGTLELVRLLKEKSGRVVSTYLVAQILADSTPFGYIKWLGSNDKRIARRACLHAVHKVAPFLWFTLSSELVRNESGQDPVSELYDKILVTISSSRNFPTLFDGYTISKAQRTLSNISLLSINALRNLKHEYVDSATPLATSNVSFTRKYIEMCYQARSRSLTVPPDVRWDVASAVDFGTSPTYEGGMNALFLPLMLQIPHVFYGKKSLNFLNYGTLGASLARELATRVSPTTQFNETEPMWSPEALQRFMTGMACYEDTNVKYEARNSAIVSDLQLEQFLWLTSATLAYQALKNDFLDTDSNNSVWKNAQKQFFLRFCLAACESSSISNALNARVKCARPLSAIPTFADVFGCPEGSYMSRLSRSNCSV